MTTHAVYALKDPRTYHSLDAHDRSTLLHLAEALAQRQEAP